MNARTVALALALAPLGNAQDAPVRAMVATAQKQIQNRQWNEARSLLKKLDADCLAARNSNGCRPLVDYSIAYLDQQEAAEAPAEQQASLLTEARQRYQSVLALQPGNGATLNSLALVEQAMLAGSRAPTERNALIEDIVARWTRAIEVDDRNSSQYRLAFGSFLASQNRQAEALAQFQQAAQQAPGEETPRRRILEVSGALPVSDYANLCTSWEAQFPALASDCYQRLIARLHAEGQDAGQAPSENALLRWTSLVSRQDALTFDRLNSLPRGWMTNAVSELRSYVGKPTDNATVWKWWWTRPDRLSVTAEVSTTMGRQALNDPKSGPQFAASCWQGMLNARPHLAEEVGEYERSGRPMTGGGLASVLRLYQELASLYHSNPQLDPEGTKLNRMVQELFEGKGQFILERNWKATQPFHTVLAQIFVQRGVWDKGAAGAVYQLRATLDDADRRWKDPQEQFFQPLPEIKALLAQTYTKLGAARSQDAMRMFIEAARAYLDTDALDLAQEMLKMAPNTELDRILNARRTLADIDLSTPSDSVPADFLARQRFKLLTDAASKAAPNEQLAAALQTYQLVTTAHPVLVGTADVVRWKQAESRLLASLNAPTSSRNQASTIRLTLDGENHPLQIPITADTKLAAQIVAALGTQDTLTARPFLKLRQGKIEVTMSPGMDRLVTKLQGLSVVVVR